MSQITPSRYANLNTPAKRNKTELLLANIEHYFGFKLKERDLLDRTILLTIIIKFCEEIDIRNGSIHKGEELVAPDLFQTVHNVSARIVELMEQAKAACLPVPGFNANNLVKPDLASSVSLLRFFVDFYHYFATQNMVIFV